MRMKPENYTLSDCGEYLVSPLKVMKSAAGYYIGRDYIEADPNGEHFPLPWDRETGYYRDREMAVTVLDMINALSED